MHLSFGYCFYLDHTPKRIRKPASRSPMENALLDTNNTIKMMVQNRQAPVPSAPVPVPSTPVTNATEQYWDEPFIMKLRLHLQTLYASKQRMREQQIKDIVDNLIKEDRLAYSIQ